MHSKTHANVRSEGETYLYALDPAIAEHVRAAGAKRVILTHMSAEMLAHTVEVPEECAADGTVIER